METSPVDIGATIAYGVMFDPKNGAKAASMDFNELRASAEKLFDLLEERKIDYVLVGGIAMLAYVEGRNSQRVDLIISRSDVAKLPELVVEDENKELLRAKFGELQVDVLLVSTRLFAEVAKSHAAVQEFAGRSVPCATPEGLALLKLFALPTLYRQWDFSKVRIYESDIDSLLDQYQVDPAKLEKGLKGKVLDSDLEEIAKILADIKQRATGKRARFGGQDERS